MFVPWGNIVTATRQSVSKTANNANKMIGSLTGMLSVTQQENIQSTVIHKQVTQNKRNIHCRDTVVCNYLRCKFLTVLQIFYSSHIYVTLLGSKLPQNKTVFHRLRFFYEAGALCNTMCVQIEELFCSVLYSRQVMIYHSNVSVQCYIISKPIKFINENFHTQDYFKDIGQI